MSGAASGGSGKCWNMEINVKETLRYLGYKGREADAAVMELVEACWAELETAAAVRSVYREYPLSVEGDFIDAWVFQTVSRDLAKNLRGCGRILLLAVSLGTGVDQLLKRYSRLQMSKAVVLQAASAAYLEDCCDGINASLKAEYGQKGLYLRPRFSPGYGDFSLECQRGILQSLEAGKRVGITLTDSLLMAPSKSVTAVIGLSRTPLNCAAEGCGECRKTDCAFRLE